MTSTLPVPIMQVRGLPFGIYTASTLCIGHLSESALADPALLEFLLTQFRALHVYEQQFLVILVDQILNVESNGVLATSWTTNFKLGIQRTHSFCYF